MLLTLSIILASSSCSIDTEAEETPRKPIIYDYDNSFPSETEEADVYPTLEEFINKDIYLHLLLDIHPYLHNFI